MLGFHLADGGLVRTELHDRVGLLQAVAAILQVGLEAVRLVHEVLQGAVPTPTPVVGHQPASEHDNPDKGCSKCIICKGKHAASSPGRACCGTLAAPGESARNPGCFAKLPGRAVRCT
jgi:hypothetical protein